MGPAGFTMFGLPMPGFIFTVSVVRPNGSGGIVPAFMK